MPATTAEDRTYAMLSHTGAILSLVLSLGGLGWVVPLFMWLLNRERRPFVAFHALQALLFNLLWMAIFGITAMVVLALCMLLIGLALLPLVFIVWLIPLIWSAVAAIKASAGEWYLLPGVGKFALAHTVVQR